VKEADELLDAAATNEWSAQQLRTKRSNTGTPFAAQTADPLP